MQQVFQIKSSSTRDVYYAPFIDKFFDRLEEARPAAGRGPPRADDGGTGGVGGRRPAAPAAHAFDDGRRWTAAVAGRPASLDRRSFDEDGSQPTSPASAAARRLDPLDEVTSATTAETLTVQLDRRTLRVLAAIGAGARRLCLYRDGRRGPPPRAPMTAPPAINESYCHA